MSKASVHSHASKISESSKPSAYKSLLRSDVDSASVPKTQRSKLSAKQLEERRKNKHLIFKYFRMINEFQVSPSSSRISSVQFRDDMVLVTSDFDGNVKFNIWKTGILVRDCCGCVAVFRIPVNVPSSPSPLPTCPCGCGVLPLPSLPLSCLSCARM